MVNKCLLSRLGAFADGVLHERLEPAVSQTLCKSKAKDLGVEEDQLEEARATSHGEQQVFKFQKTELVINISIDFKVFQLGLYL